MTTERSAGLRRIESEVGVLIRRVKRVIGDRARMIHPDLHPVTYLLLAHLIDSGPQRAADLVGAFGMDKGGVSRQVQHLVDLGLVERQPDPDDRRAQLLAPTPDAVTRMGDVARARSERFDRQLADWSDEEVADFADRLGRYNAALADD